MQRDCLARGGGAIPQPVPTPPHARYLLAPACLLALACAACQAPGSKPLASASDSVPPVVEPAPASAPAWWQGDATLGELMTAGLAHDSGLQCRIDLLRAQDADAAARSRQLGSKLGRLLGERENQTGQTARAVLADRIAARRDSVAQRIAAAYFEARRLQRREALRSAILDQFRDNAEVAEFRRQAGLVPAIDGALARTQNEAARAELDFDRDRFDQVVAELASLTGDTPAALVARLSASARPSTEPPVAAGNPAPANASRSQRLVTARDAARRTVRDARTAYRDGAANFATLYVAEAAALSLEQALADEQVREAAAFWHERALADAAWAKAGLEPDGASPSPATSTAAVSHLPASTCD